MRSNKHESNLARNERILGELEIGGDPVELLSDMPAGELASLLSFASKTADVELLDAAGSIAQEQCDAAQRDDPCKRQYGAIATMAGVILDHHLRENSQPGYLLVTDITLYRQLIAVPSGSK